MTAPVVAIIALSIAAFVLWRILEVIEVRRQARERGLFDE
jgi:hypothetical protein